MAGRAYRPENVGRNSVPTFARGASYAGRSFSAAAQSGKSLPRSTRRRPRRFAAGAGRASSGSSAGPPTPGTIAAGARPVATVPRPGAWPRRRRSAREEEEDALPWKPPSFPSSGIRVLPREPAGCAIFATFKNNRAPHCDASSSAVRDASPEMAYFAPVAWPVARRERSKIGGTFPAFRPAPCGLQAALRARHSYLQWKIVHHLVAGVGDDEGVAEENAEQAVGRDRVGLRHDDHAGLEHGLELRRRDVVGGGVRVVGAQIAAVARGRARLIAVVAEEPAGEPHRFRRLAGRDFIDDATVAGQRELVPEFLHHLGRLPDRDGRADLRGVAAI